MVVIQEIQTIELCLLQKIASKDIDKLVAALIREGGAIWQPEAFTSFSQRTYAA